MKGVTPVVATTMLVLIAMGASFTAYNFIQGTIQDFQDRTEDKLSEEELKSGSEIGIDSAYNNTSNITMIVRNTGQYPVEYENWQMFVDGRPRTSDSNIPSTGGLKPQNTTTLNTDIQFPSSDVKVIEIKGEYVSTSVVCSPSGNRC